jgi:hypothetical protein
MATQIPKAISIGKAKPRVRARPTEKAQRVVSKARPKEKTWAKVKAR